MSVVVTERIESRRMTVGVESQQSTLELDLNVMGTDSEQVASVAVDNWAPPVWGPGTPRLYRQRFTIEYFGSDLWRARVFYDTTDPSLSAENSFEFDTSGGSERITQSLATISVWGGGPDFQGAIGVSDSGVEGVDIVVPRIVFSFTNYYGEVSPEYRALLIELTASVNQYPFKGLAAGEVLFLGANVRRNDSRFGTPWVVTYQFAVQRNRSNFNVGGITVGHKAGWDYLWARYEQAVDTDAVALVRRPTAVYVERVYPPGDFARLGI